ncbi:MAG TPA: hypothetical protein VHZ78_00370 [Rhizomicrobium sp.]|jgi:hypothetical protein|nr:hypothetical protein [Rhizomicrobium sp.]
MQLSAANLLIASQQLARGSQQPSPQAQAQFSAALAKENGVEDFAPLDFKKSAPAAKAPDPAPAPAPSTGYGGASPLGARLDIRV